MVCSPLLLVRLFLVALLFFLCLAAAASSSDSVNGLINGPDKITSRTKVDFNPAATKSFQVPYQSLAFAKLDSNRGSQSLWWTKQNCGIASGSKMMIQMFETDGGAA